MPTTFLKQLRHTYNLPRLQEACINNKQINDAFTGQKLYIFDLQNFLDNYPWQLAVYKSVHYVCKDVIHDSDYIYNGHHYTVDDATIICEFKKLLQDLIKQHCKYGMFYMHPSSFNNQLISFLPKTYPLINCYFAPLTSSGIIDLIKKHCMLTLKGHSTNNSINLDNYVKHLLSMSDQKSIIHEFVDQNYANALDSLYLNSVVGKKNMVEKFNDLFIFVQMQKFFEQNKNIQLSKSLKTINDIIQSQCLNQILFAKRSPWTISSSRSIGDMCIIYNRVYQSYFVPFVNKQIDLYFSKGTINKASIKNELENYLDELYLAQHQGQVVPDSKQSHIERYDDFKNVGTDTPEFQVINFNKVINIKLWFTISLNGYFNKQKFYLRKNIKANRIYRVPLKNHYIIWYLAQDLDSHEFFVIKEAQIGIPVLS